ncbi:DNA-binding transcriptional LysR family regulator [Pseudomonas sp. 2957]|jgi:DNA-binding transcriptional LysR family regulator|uniref:HTH-type transcriptional regulator DmlR n=2 Tax=Pseudomonas TaxID=286 RepID=A0A5E7K0I5_PSEFL|nr:MULTISPECIES: LysR family transcriptional regulator [Pseudomonas]KQT66791.1 LysR family transcriptional regulator [Pseudomonas sp. Leaf434]MDH2077499.1 LysR family transcriptional regulator [Pseudomonas atacamensis]MDR6945716.1 DNA-binding transcriptional LysR family regulator [Pseudomonas sp. 2957]MEB2652124.1 LysR family transcriptional regulator [Pseudomonas siliginis]UST75644.1 LysR family transcriptional regulator [Pseudomonas siliginis]
MSEMDDLAAFAVLIEAGSFTLAAQQLGCSKGQLSKRISQLEAQFGVVLLQRTTRRLSLTAAGAALLPQAQALVVQVERARQALARLKDDMAGPVRMTVPVSLGETFFDGLLLEFSGQYPEVQIELELNNSYRDLSRDGFDLAIRAEVANDDRLVAKPLLAWHEMTCASPAYLERFGEPATPHALAEHRCLLNSHYSGREEWLYHQQHELLRVRVSGPFASNHYSLLKKAALSGAGIARLPSYLLQAELADGRLRWLLRDYQTRRMPMYLVHPYQGGLPKRTQVLADYLMGWFKRSGEALDRLQR